jgi:hypothetical protein
MVATFTTAAIMPVLLAAAFLLKGLMVRTVSPARTVPPRTSSAEALLAIVTNAQLVLAPSCIRCLTATLSTSPYGRNRSLRRLSSSNQPGESTTPSQPWTPMPRTWRRVPSVSSSSDSRGLTFLAALRHIRRASGLSLTMDSGIMERQGGKHAGQEPSYRRQRAERASSTPSGRTSLTTHNP